MARYSVIQTGGKQYLVQENDTVVVQRINTEEGTKEVDCDVLMSFDDETGDINLGAPTLKEKATVELVSDQKGEKIRIAKFKSKVRYRKVRGFRPSLTTIKISAESK